MAEERTADGGKQTADQAVPTRIALIGIIVENMESVEPLNALLHEYGSCIIGRMGVPYRP